MATSSGKALKEKQNKLTLMEKVLMRDKHDKHNKHDKHDKHSKKETKATSGDAQTVAREEGKVKVSLMDKVLMRDKNEKHNRKDRGSKGTSRDLDTMSLDGDVVAKQHKTSIMDRVFMRERRERISKRMSKAFSRGDLEDVTKISRDVAVEGEEADAVSGLLSDVAKLPSSGTLYEEVRLRHEVNPPAWSREERDARAVSAPACAAAVDVYKSTSMGDLRDLRYGRAGGDSPLRRGGLDRSNSKRENRLSSNAVLKWFKHITEAAESYKGKEKPTHRPSVRKAGSSSSVNESAGSTETVQEEERTTQEEEDRTRKDSKEERMGGLLERHASSSVDSVENLEQAEVLHINQSADLIQPSEVCVSDTMVMVEEAQPVRTNHELLVEKDQLISRAIEEKQSLVAQILNVPAHDFQHVAEIATEDEGDKGARELLLAAIYQATQLTSLLNASLNAATSTSTVTISHSSHSNENASAQQPQVQEDAAQGSAETPEDRLLPCSAGSDVTPPQASGSEALTVRLPCQQVNTVTSRLNLHLTQLLDVMTRREEETERLQQELKETTDELGRLRGASPTNLTNPSRSQPTSRPDSYVSSASDTGELGAGDGLTLPVTNLPVHTDNTSLLNTSSESPKLTPIVVSHVVTSEVSMEKMASLTINDPVETVLTSSPTTVTSQQESGVSDVGSAEDVMTLPPVQEDYDVIEEEETAQLV